MLDNLTSDFNHVPYLTSHTPDISFLSFPFYLDMVGYLCTNEGYCLEQEGFEQFFFGLTLSGSGTLKFKENRYTLGEDQAFLLDRREYFKIGTCKGGKWNFKWFYFGGTACREYYELINGKAFQPVSMANAAETGSLIDELYSRTQARNPLADTEISLLITRILTDVVKSKYQNTGITAGKSEILKTALDYILDNYTKPIKISDVCQAAFVSKSHLISLFRTHMHTTPHKYITKLRIDKSKRLLSETRAPLGEISRQAGFETTGLLIENFRQYTGTTPNQYRKTALSLISPEA